MHSVYSRAWRLPSVTWLRLATFSLVRFDGRPALPIRAKDFLRQRKRPLKHTNVSRYDTSLSRDFSIPLRRPSAPSKVAHYRAPSRKLEGVARGGNSLEPRRERKLKHPPTLDA
jgi:hypothetical protein